MRICKLAVVFYFSAILTTMLIGFAHAEWVEVGGILNIDPNQSINYPFLMGRGNTPYVCWAENSVTANQIYVKHWNGSSWEQDGGSLNMDPNLRCFNPTLGFSNNTPYAAWKERETKDKVYVKSFNNVSWNQVGTSFLNVDSNRHAYTPHLANVNNTPYVVWEEYYTSIWRKVWVKYWSGSQWNLRGSALNVDMNMAVSNPRLAVNNNTPWVTWGESSSSANSFIYVKYWCGADWEQVGSNIGNLITTAPRNPHLAFVGNTPYIGWRERSNTGMNKTNVYVKYWNGAAWLPAGGSLNIDENSASSGNHLLTVNNALYATWYEQDLYGKYHVYVKIWHNNQWKLVGEDIGMGGSNNTYYPYMADVNNTLYIGFLDDDGVTNQLHVKKYLTPTSTSTVTQTATITPTATITLTSTISPTSTITPTITPTSALAMVDMGDKKALAYPVPATDRMHFLLQLDEAAQVKISIYNTVGERIAKLSEDMPAGQGRVLTWICTEVGPGTYFARVVVNNTLVETLKIAIVGMH